MNNILEKNNNIEQVFKKLNQVKIFKKLEKNLDRIFFVGDNSTLTHLQDNLCLKTNESKFECLEFDITCPEESLANLNQIKHSINKDIVVIASLKHEKNIYNLLIKELKQKILLLFDDVFINLVIKRKALASIPDDYTSPQTNYCILSTPRSGSTMLCDALISTKLAGFPQEHLREPSLMLAEHCNFSTDRYIKAIMSLHVTQNSVFGTKLISHFIEKYLNLSIGSFNPLSYFSNFIYLIRRDKVAQAVSLFLAQKSGVWHISETQKLSNYQDKIDSELVSDDDLEKVHFLYNRLLDEERFLEAICERENIKPLTVFYEDLVQDLSSNICIILNYLNIVNEPNLAQLDISVKKQKLSSELSNKIIELYKKKFLA